MFASFRKMGDKTFQLIMDMWTAAENRATRAEFKILELERSCKCYHKYINYSDFTPEKLKECRERLLAAKIVKAVNEGRAVKAVKPVKAEKAEKADSQGLPAVSKGKAKRTLPAASGVVLSTSSETSPEAPQHLDRTLL
jgi:hypothetical protein